MSVFVSFFVCFFREVGRLFYCYVFVVLLWDFCCCFFWGVCVCVVVVVVVVILPLHIYIKLFEVQVLSVLVII